MTVRVRDRIEWSGKCGLPPCACDSLTMTEEDMRATVKDAILRGDGDPVIIEEGDGYVEYEHSDEV